MIAQTPNYLRKICKEYERVENYEAAVADKMQRWDLHHRREISENKSRKQLIDEGKYYNVPAEDLIFLTASEHNILHHKGKILSEEHKKKMSESLSGENNPMYGRTGEKNPCYGRTGENHPFYGKHWWNNGIINVVSKERPGHDFVKGKLKKK